MTLIHDPHCIHSEWVGWPVSASGSGLALQKATHTRLASDFVQDAHIGDACRYNMADQSKSAEKFGNASSPVSR